MTTFTWSQALYRWAVGLQAAVASKESGIIQYLHSSIVDGEYRRKKTENLKGQSPPLKRNLSDSVNIFVQNAWTVSVIVFLLASTFRWFFGVLLPFTTQLTSRSSSTRCQLNCLRTSWKRWPQTTTTSDRRWMQWVRWDCCPFRKSAQLSVSSRLVLAWQNTMISIIWGPQLAWKPWKISAI